MNWRNCRLFGVATLFFVTLHTTGQTVTSSSAEHILTNMFDSVYALENVRFDMYSQERINGELVKSHAVGVMEYSPRNIFIRGFDTQGVLLNEILYKEGTNNNDALISPNGFPYININLDPEGNTMRRNRHFTILEAGGRYLVDMLKIGMVTYAKSGDINERLKVKSKDSLWIVTITNTDYSKHKYLVQPGENSRTIARKLGVPEYKMVELNENIDTFDDVQPGEIIFVPNYYAQKVELVLRKSDNVPIRVRVFDEKGLYSEYKYAAFETNTQLSSKTFNKENPAYTF